MKWGRDRFISGVMSAFAIMLCILWGSAHAMPSKKINAAQEENCGLGMPNTPIEMIKLEPRIREMPLSTGYGIAIGDLRPFMKPSLILDNPKQYKAAPYIIAENEQRLEGGPDSVLYVRGICNVEEPTYTIYREGKTLCHPMTHEILGFEAIAIGTAELQAVGDPSQLVVTKADENIEVGDRVLPSFAAVIPPCMKIKPACATQEGFILSSREGGDVVGRNQVVTISLGLREGLEEGQILEIYQSQPVVKDPLTKKRFFPCKVRLPDVPMGRLLVYQTFEKLSIALIVESKGPIRILDKVRNP